MTDLSLQDMVSSLSPDMTPSQVCCRPPSGSGTVPIPDSILERSFPLVLPQSPWTAVLEAASCKEKILRVKQLWSLIMSTPGKLTWRRHRAPWI